MGLVSLGFIPITPAKRWRVNPSCCLLLLVMQAKDCDLYPVGDPFETFNLAVAFPPDAPDALPAAVSASIVRLQVGLRFIK